jgi:hypothetical protein
MFFYSNNITWAHEIAEVVHPNAVFLPARAILPWLSGGIAEILRYA